MVNYGRIELTGRTTVRLTTTPIDSGVEVAFVPSSTDVIVYDVEDGHRINSLRGHYHRVNCAVYCSPTRTLFTGSNDRAIVVWTPAVDEPLLAEKRPKKYDGRGSPDNDGGRSSLGRFARRVGGGTADAWSDED
jgi:DNA excision repair protein ERCC-8